MHLRVSSDRAQHKRDLKQCKARIAEIEDLYAKLYENVSKGLLPEKRFQMLADRYDKEQACLLYTSPHFKITIVKRSQGQSAVAGAAYQSGERLFSEYDQRTKFYNKKKEIVHAEIMLPYYAPPGYADRATPVSYTHLDVYKRQRYSRRPHAARTPDRSQSPSHKAPFPAQRRERRWC